MDWKRLSDRIELILFILIMISNENFLYLLNTNVINISGSFNINDIGAALIVIWGIFIFIKYKNIKVSDYKFKLIILFLPVLILTSSFQSLQLYGQSFLMGIRPQRFFIIAYLLYFPFLKALKSNSKFYSNVLKSLYIIGGIELFLYITQYFLISKFVFLYVPVSERFDANRLQFGSMILMILPFIALNNIINNYKIKANIFLLMCLMFFYIVVTKTRLTSIGLVIAIILIILVQRKSVSPKILLVTFGTSAIIIMSLTVPIVRSYIQVLNSSYIANDQSAVIRNEGKTFYLNQIKKSPLLGRGYINILNDNARISSGYDNNYFLNDNGVIGFYYIYGLLGIAWLIIFAIMLYKYGIRSAFKYGDYTYLGYLIFMAIICTNIIRFYWGGGPAFTVIFFALNEFNIAHREDGIQSNLELQRVNT